MKLYIASIIMICMTFIAFSPLSYADDQPSNPVAVAPADDIANGNPAAGKDKQPARKHSRLLGGVSAHSSIGGGGTLPEGVLTTAYNVNFSDKTNAKDGYKGSDVFGQTHLVKIRYGLTNRIELTSIGGYVNNGSRNPTPRNRPNNMEGLLDQTVGVSYSPLQIHQGDPFALSFGASLSLPTGIYGKNHIPGGGVWGGRLSTGLAAFLNEDIRVDTEISWTMPFERGNQKVKRGDQYQWNTMARYLFGWFDVGVESVYTYYKDGDKITPFGKKNLRNGGKDWYVGPATTIAIDDLSMWFSAGVYFPVLQDMKSPSKVDDIQYHFKIGRAW